MMQNRIGIFISTAVSKRLFSLETELEAFGRIKQNENICSRFLLMLCVCWAVDFFFFLFSYFISGIFHDL